MNSQELIGFIKHPERLDQDSISPLRETVAHYPYCSSAQMLLALNLFRENTGDFPARLKIAAAAAASRTKLKRLLTEFDPQVVRPVEESVTIAETPFIPSGPEELSDKAPENSVGNEPEIVRVNERAREELLEIVKKRLAEIRAEREAMAQEIHPPEIKTEEKKENVLTKEEIIERFIREEPRISSPKAEFYSPSELAIRSNLDDDELVSETLAQLCVEQGNRQRAISIYERLCLLIPEKSVYFAARIKKLKDFH